MLLAPVSPTAPTGGYLSTWVTTSVVSLASIDERGTPGNARGLYSRKNSGVAMIERASGAGLADAIVHARDRARTGPQAGAQAVLRAKDGAYWVMSLGIQMQSGSSPVQLKPTNGGRELWLRSSSDALRAVVDATMWVDFSGNPRPQPISGAHHFA